jgi:hypothetical protein
VNENTVKILIKWVEIMSISISNQIYLLQNGSGTHTRPLPQITYDNDYIYIIVGNIFDPPKIVKCDYNLNII